MLYCSVLYYGWKLYQETMYLSWQEEALVLYGEKGLLMNKMKIYHQCYKETCQQMKTKQNKIQNKTPEEPVYLSDAQPVTLVLKKNTFFCVCVGGVSFTVFLLSCFRESLMSGSITQLFITGILLTLCKTWIKMRKRNILTHIWHLKCPTHLNVILYNIIVYLPKYP